MQGLLATALASTAPPRSQPSRPAPAPLSSANLALHTSTNPPAPRRTVQQFLASVTRVHAANAYDLGPPPAGELDYVKTPPRAVEARRKRKLQDLEDRGESWITRDTAAPRAAATTGTEQALVLIRPDADLLLRGGSTTSETAGLKQRHERKKSLVASMMRRKSTPPANASARSTTQRQPLLPIRSLSPASDESSILMPRTETKLATTRRKEVVEERGGKENKSGRETKPSLRKGKNGSRRDTDKDAEQEELEEHQARLEARRDRRRQNALIRKDRSLAATAVGATAAAKLKKSKSRQRPVTTASDSNASSDDEEEENALETTGYRKRKGKGTKDVRSRKKVAGLDRPQHVGQGRLTLKPVALGIFSKGKASARAKTGAHHHQLAFDEEAFLSGAARNGNAVASSSAASSSSASSSEESAREVPSTRRASRHVGHSAPRTYGSRPSKRRSGSAIRQRDRDADIGAPTSQEETPDRDATARHSSAAALDRTAAKRPAPAPAKKRLAATKKPTPDFELDIPPWPRASSLTRRSRLVDDDKGAGAGSADDADSTHPSILSAASLARRRAERTAVEKHMSIDAEQEVAPFDGGASVHAPARKADEPVGDVTDKPDPWQGPDDNFDSVNTSGSAFERLLAQVTNAADDSFEALPPSFEALSARSAIVGGSGLQDQLRGVLPPEPASKVGRAAADAYLVAAAAGTIEEEDPTTVPYVDNTLISFPNETVFEEAEPVAFADLDGAQSASTAAAVAFHPLTPLHGATITERFPTPSDLSPSFVVADHDDIRLDEDVPMVLDDDAAFRTAMRQQWPKTLL